jgi:hypothetical protein
LIEIKPSDMEFPIEILNAYYNLRSAMSNPRDLCLCPIHGRGDETALDFALGTRSPQFLAAFQEISGFGIVPLAIVLSPGNFEEWYHPPLPGLQMLTEEGLL